MKTLAALLFIVTAQLVVAPGAHAGEDPTETLEKTKKFMKDTYPGYLSNLHRSKIFNYLAWHYADYLTAVNELTLQSQVAWTQALADESKWNRLHDLALTGSPDQIEAAATDLADALTSLEFQGRRLQIIARDLETISKAWEERCSDRKLEYSFGYFEPAVLYTPSRLDLKATGYPVTVGFQVSNDFSGGIQKPAFFREEDAIIFTAGTAAAPYTFGISIAAAAIIVSVKNILIGMSVYHEQEALIREIMAVQQDAINGMQARSRDVIREACQLALPDTLGENSISAATARNAKVAKERAASATAKAGVSRVAFRDLEDRLKLQLTVIVKAKSEHVRKEFLQNIAAIDVELEGSDEQIENELPALMSLVTQRRAAESPLTRTELNQKLWDRLLTDEARFAPDENFTEFTLWKQTENFIRGEVAK